MKIKQLLQYLIVILFLLVSCIGDIPKNQAHRIAESCLVNIAACIVAIHAPVDAPTFSPPAGTYSSAQSVTISTTTTGAILCYTTNGSTPSCDSTPTCASGTLYSSPVSIGKSVFLRAITCKDSRRSSLMEGVYAIGNVPTILATMPVDGATSISISSTISITFDRPMNPATITNTTTTTCLGSFQVSLDNFATCLVMTSITPIANADNTTFTATAAALLQEKMTYLIRVAAPASDAQGNAMSSTFTTSIGFVIADITPPNAISTLEISSMDDSSFELSWIAVGNDGIIGTASSYALRYLTGASCPIDASNFPTANPVVSGIPIPIAAGGLQTMTLTSLPASTKYCFAMTVTDGYNTSGLSNVVIANTAMIGNYVRTTNPSGANDIPAALTINSSHMFIGGYDSNPGNTQWHTEKRLLSNGLLDTSFGVTGIITIDPNITRNDSVTKIEISGQYLIIAGRDNFPSNDRWRVEKRDKDTGLLIPSFGVAGTVLTGSDISGCCDSDILTDIWTDGTNLFLAGRNWQGAGLRGWRTEKRSFGTGTFDASYGVGGALSTALWGNIPGPGSMAVDGGSIFLGGTWIDGSGWQQWRIEKRDSLTGALDPAFGTSGVIQEALTIFQNNSINAVVFDAANLYVVGSNGSSRHWRIEKRNKFDGSLIPAFGTGGLLIRDLSAGNDIPVCAFIDGSYLYVGGNSVGLFGSRWHIERYDIVTGVLDTTFGVGGSLIIDPSQYDDSLSAIRFDTSSLYIIGSDYSRSNTNARWRIEKRNKSDGNL